jgi:FHA domain
MDILSKARRLESTLTRSLDDAARRFARPGARQPLETVHAVVHAVEARLEPAGRGRHVFPFNRIKVLVAAENRDVRSRFEAVFGGDPSLERRIAERLEAAGCETNGLQVKTHFTTRPEPNWLTPEFHVEFDRVAVASRPTADEQPEPEQLTLTIVTGTAQQPTYVFALPRINIGRCPEVRDGHHRLLRTNHIAFVDGAGSPNHTVSRRHAHIDHVASSGIFRVCDDGSSHGTSVIRNGRTISVPAGSRGIRLQAGDDIVLGEAVVRIGLGSGLI